MDDPNNAAHVGIKGATLDPALVRIEHFTQKLPHHKYARTEL